MVSFLFVALGGMLVVPAPATAGVAISDKLTVFGDVRVRYEQDREDRTGTNIDRDRDRARMRARFGFKHKTTDKITMGLRFATRADALQSPHRDMEVANPRDDFGLDRAYIETKWGKGGFLWLGKHGISFWEQNEQFWDGDIQPEGAGVGYKFGLGDGANLLLQSTYTYITENGFGDVGTEENSIFEDDAGLTLQAVLTKGGATAAIGVLSVQDGGTANIRGGDADYYIASAQYKVKSDGLPIKLGVDFLWSDGVHYATNSVTGPSVNSEDDGYILNASTKSGDWSFQFKHYDIGLNSVPLQGQVSQDNFRYSSNFDGQRYQVGYSFGGGVSMDGRIYHQNQKATGLTVPGTSNGHVQNTDENTRYQVNLNAKF
jgi:hypothetical protein